MIIILRPIDDREPAPRLDIQGDNTQQVALTNSTTIAAAPKYSTIPDKVLKADEPAQQIETSSTDTAQVSASERDDKDQPEAVAVSQVTEVPSQSQNNQFSEDQSPQQEVSR